MSECKSKNIQLQYQGYLNTSLLWKEHALLGLQQLELQDKKTTQFNEEIPENLRLGKRVERYVYAELTEHQNIEILLENAQIQNNKITVGEIDCILKLNQKPIHLEIVYKFYLYDPKTGSSEIEHWIGPNRNDNLLKKLHKLKDKQLPLLYNEHTQSVLKSINLNSEDIQQNVLFKAQLFTPYKSTVNFELLNKECVAGFYIHLNEIGQFLDCKFYIPTKVNWLLEVHSKVNWMMFDQFNLKITSLISQKRAPLCWLKFQNGTIQKLFVVWWS